MKNNIVQLPLEQLRAPISNVDAAARTFTVQWLSGERVKRLDWMTGRPYWLEFSKDAGAVRLGRLKSGRAPLLDSHASFSVRDQLGVVDDANYANGIGTATVRLSARDDVKPILQDVQDKIIANVSIGVSILKKEVLPPDAKSEGLDIHLATEFEPYELSLVPVGADSGAGVVANREQRLDDERLYPCEILDAGVRNQRAVTRTSHEEPMKTQQLAVSAPVQDALEELGPRARALYENLLSNESLDRALLDEIFVRGESLRAVRLEVLNALAAKSEGTPIRSGSFADAHVLNGDRGVELAAMSEAIHARFGGPAPSERAKQFMGMRVLDFAKLALQRNGISTMALSSSRIVTLALHSTSDFPALLEETGNRTLRNAYGSYQGGLRRICRRSSAPDFRAKMRLNLGEAPGLLKVLQGGEFTYGSMAEAKESYKVETFGRIFSITRQALVNDDLGAFVDVVGKYGRAAAEFEAQQLVNLLTSNPNMNDGVALFHANHKNLSGTNDAIAVASLGAAKEAMRLQKGLDGKTAIDVTPKFLVVPAKKETIAQQFLVQIQASQPANANPFAGNLELVVDPRLDAVSTTAWYLAADPEQIDTLEYSYLEDFQGPRIEQQVGFKIDGLEIKVAMDFGAGAIDHRGLFKNPGA